MATRNRARYSPFHPFFYSSHSHLFLFNSPLYINRHKWEREKRGCSHYHFSPGLSPIRVSSLALSHSLLLTVPTLLIIPYQLDKYRVTGFCAHRDLFERVMAFMCDIWRSLRSSIDSKMFLSFLIFSLWLRVLLPSSLVMNPLNAGARQTKNARKAPTVTPSRFYLVRVDSFVSWQPSNRVLFLSLVLFRDLEGRKADPKCQKRKFRIYFLVIATITLEGAAKGNCFVSPLRFISVRFKLQDFQ